LLDGARPDDRRDGNCRGASEAISDHAKYARGEQKSHVAYLGYAHDLFMGREDTRHDEIVGARDDR
jgi:hypothetical protein